ncbi:immunity 8 family protein [Burkholderia sp. WSM2230]|uniref:immunity 8 family protein n=1 Tax=Burkholderia sp. WSM2230 TaxID=944435 RepID=UPI0009FDC063|nr:immunity 8 family protein [Burkholderia sp. WSM2230]
MNAEIRKLYSLEVEDDLVCYQPTERDNFGTWIRLSIGAVGQPGTDNFELLVCTPQWLSQELKREAGTRWGRHSLIVIDYDLAVITGQLQRMVQQCAGPDWQSIAVKIARFAAWEFEDYRM